MTIEYDAENWPDNPTREEMMRQHIHLLEEECRLFQLELNRYRKNLAKLIDIHTDVTIERDKIRAELKQTEARLSDCLRENSSLSNRIGGLEGCRDQLEEIYKAQRESRASVLPSSRRPK